MKVARGLQEVARGKRAVALGIFDGVHLGHQAVIGDAMRWAAEHGVPAAAVTFEPHPERVLRPERAPDLIMPLQLKLEAIEALGCDETVVIEFDREFSLIEPNEFCRSVLAETLGAVHVSIGANFHFGRGARADSGYMSRRGEELGYAVSAVDLVELHGGSVSSSRIRALISDGLIEEAGTLLGRPFTFTGQVAAGDGRGRELGFPTANLEPAEGQLAPGFGVYAAVANDRWPAAVNVGQRPTFERAGRPVVEAYLLDFDNDLYGGELRLVFIRRLRDELKFESVDELIEQMHEDVEETRAVLARNRKD